MTTLEQPRGQGVFTIPKGNGTKNLARMRVRTPTSQNIAGMVAALANVETSRRPWSTSRSTRASAALKGREMGVFKLGADAQEPVQQAPDEALSVRGARDVREARDRST